MFPGMNPRDIEKVMKQMGMKQVDIPATEVIIKCADKELVISSPKVSKINMMGQETIQIVGKIEERLSSSIDPADIALVAEQASVSEQKAEACLKEANGDLAKAIILAKKH